MEKSQFSMCQDELFSTTREFQNQFWYFKCFPEQHQLSSNYQGSINTLFSYGEYEKGILVLIMSFRKHLSQAVTLWEWTAMHRSLCFVGVRKDKKKHQSTESVLLCGLRDSHKCNRWMRRILEKPSWQLHFVVLFSWNGLVLWGPPASYKARYFYMWMCSWICN